MIRDFYFPRLEKTEIIEEFDGRIIIGEDEDTFLLEGVALPRVDASGFVIAGEYVLGEFDLFQSDADLVITKTGSDLSRENPAQIIIKNFPFYSGGFGFFLNRLPSDDLLPAKEFEDRELFNQTVFAASDVRQRFFAPAKITAADGTINYAIKTFDARGFGLGTQLLTNFSSTENGADANFPSSVTGYVIENDLIARRLENGHVALIYEVREEIYGVKNSLLSCASLTFLAVVNENGLILSNQQISEIASSDEKNFTTLEPATIGNKSGKNFACFSKSNGSGFICQEFDLNGQLIGEEFETNSINEYKNPNNFGNSLAGLSQGYKIEADIPNGFKIFTPFHKNSSNRNVAKNYYLQEPQITLPNDKKAMISFCEEIYTLAKITRNPNSTLVVSGLDLSLASQIDLRDFELSLEEVLENSFAASPTKYSLTDLLDHKFSAKNNLPEAASAENNLLFDTARDVAVLELPENQQIIFLNFSLKNFREFAAELLVLSDDDLQKEQQLDQ